MVGSIRRFYGLISAIILIGANDRMRDGTLVSQGMQGREAESVAQGTPGVQQVVNLLAVPH